MKNTRYFSDYQSAYDYYGGTVVPSNEIALIGNASYIFVSSDNSYNGNTQYFDANMTNDEIVDNMITAAYNSGYTAGTTYGYDLGYTAGTTYGYDLGYTAGTTYGYDLGYTAGYSYGYSIGYDEGYAAGEAVTPPTPEFQPCVECGGTGFIESGVDPETGDPIMVPCSTCNGTGQVPVA